MKTSTTNIKVAPAQPARKAKKGSVGKRIFALYAVLTLAVAVALFAYDGDGDAGYEMYDYGHNNTSHVSQYYNHYENYCNHNEWHTDNYIADINNNRDIELMVGVHINVANEATALAPFMNLSTVAA